MPRIPCCTCRLGGLYTAHQRVLVEERFGVTSSKVYAEGIVLTSASCSFCTWRSMLVFGECNCSSCGAHEASVSQTIVQEEFLRS